MSSSRLLRNRVAKFALAALFAVVIVPGLVSEAQTFTVLHDFTGRDDGWAPSTGLTLDSAGNLYGTAANGGSNEHGVVFKLSPRGSGWEFATLYEFQGGTDGYFPSSRVAIGPNGSLYGVTESGGDPQCNPPFGCGTVYNLKPPAHLCASLQCRWIETVLYRFSGGSDGELPAGDLIFDRAGNLYGTTGYGGLQDCGGQTCGTVYELAASPNGWTESILFLFTGGSDGYEPWAGVNFDAAGNLYGTTVYGGINDCGTIFQLTPSGSGWTQSFQRAFQGSSDGCESFGGFVFDRSGNLYGTTTLRGPSGGGAVFQLAPSGSGWTFQVISALAGSRIGPSASLTMDAAGNLYGTTDEDGAHQYGSVFKLMRNGSHWTYIDLHDFTGGSDGGYSFSTVAIGANGSLYGTTIRGGANNFGTVWQITP